MGDLGGGSPHNKAGVLGGGSPPTRGGRNYVHVFLISGPIGAKGHVRWGVNCLDFEGGGLYRS